MNQQSIQADHIPKRKLSDFFPRIYLLKKCEKFQKKFLHHQQYALHFQITEIDAQIANQKRKRKNS